MLKTLIAVKEQGSFSAAADAVYITHAAVSQQMRALEQNWGLNIFDRSSRTPKLTPVGRALVVKARSIVDAYDNIVDSVIKDDGLKGEFYLGAVSTALTGLIPLALALLKDRYAELHVRIAPGRTNNLYVQVLTGKIDAAIISKPTHLDRDAKWLKIADEPFLLLAPQKTPSDDPIFLLENYPFIRFSRDTMIGRMVDYWLQDNKIKVKESMELEGIEPISNMVLANLGVAIIPRKCVQNMNYFPLKRIKLKHTPVRQLGLVSHEHTPKFRVVEQMHLALMDAIKIGEFKSEKPILK